MSDDPKRQPASEQLGAEDFERRFQALLAERHAAENERCIECVRCSGCSACTFCRSSQRLVRCHYCVECQRCVDSSHCRRSQELLGCQHCVECESCSGSAYLIRCIALADCTYCFGCVGLQRRDFHILNEPYSREAYFETVARLKRQLRL